MQSNLLSYFLTGEPSHEGSEKEKEVKDEPEQKREIGYYDLNQNRWNYPAISNLYNYSQQRHEMPQPYPYLRRSPLSTNYFPEPTRNTRFDSMSSEFSNPDKFPYSAGFDQPRYSNSDAGFCSYDQSRQFPYPADFMMTQYKANTPSFI